MTENTSQQTTEVTKLPNLAPRIIAVVLLVSLILLLAQYVQDHYRKEEVVETQRISLYHQQAEIIGQLINTLRTDWSYSTIRTAINELKQTQQQQIELTELIQQLGQNDNLLADESLIASSVEKIIVNANELLDAKSESVSVDTSKLHELYQQYSKQNTQLISQLTSHLYSESEVHRKIAWWLTFFSIALVFIVSLGIYWRGKKLVHQQFNTLRQLKEQIVAERNRSKENLQGVVEESNLRHIEQTKLNSILDSTVDAIITITADGTVDSFNKAAETMFGYPAESMIGKNIKILMPEPYSSEHDGYLKHYRETDEKKVIGHIREVVGKRIDGSEFPLRLSVSEVLDSTPKLFTGIIRDITQRKKNEAKLKETLAELTQRQAALEEEERIARHVFETITASNNAIISEVSSWCEPMGTFSGDMMLSAILPSGGIRIILCDFTGHGLPAALGAVPVSTIHSAMAKKGLPLEVLMNELNEKLNVLLPTGIFCCIAGVDLDETRTQAQIWNAGLPDVLVVDDSGEITQRISSSHLPVGITSYSKSELHSQTIDLDKGDAIYVLSDGLTEAENESGELFGQQRFEQLLMRAIDGHGRLDHIRNSVGKFVGDAVATDDISLIEIKTVSTIS
jgi:PAS domain S-box-containing protein